MQEVEEERDGDKQRQLLEEFYYKEKQKMRDSSPKDVELKEILNLFCNQPDLYQKR